MRTWMWIVAGIVIGLPLLAFVVGTFVPRDHVARMSIELASPPDRVWALVSDAGRLKEWGGDVPFEVVSQDAPRRQVTRVIDTDQPFGGTWTFDLEPTPAGTRVTLTEAGFVKSALFRGLGLVFHSPETSIKGYLRSLAKALGDTAEPRRVD